MLVGAPGLGKTTLLGVIAQQLAETCDLAVLSAGLLTTRRSLLQSILYDCKCPVSNATRATCVLRCSIDFHSSMRPLVILCDEAHTLPQRLLEELRLLNNVVRKR